MCPKPPSPSTDAPESGQPAPDGPKVPFLPLPQPVAALGDPTSAREALETNHQEALAAPPSLLSQVAQEAVPAIVSTLPPPPLVPSPFAILNSQGVSREEIQDWLEARRERSPASHCCSHHLSQEFDLTVQEGRLEYSRWMSLRDPRVYPIGTLFTVADETIDDDDGEERVTPPGSIWEIREIEPFDDSIAQYSAVCDANGAWAKFAHSDLDGSGFAVVGMNPEIEAAFQDPPEIKIKNLEQRIEELTSKLREHEAGLAPIPVFEGAPTAADLVQAARNTEFQLRATLQDLQVAHAPTTALPEPPPALTEEGQQLLGLLERLLEASRNGWHQEWPEQDLHTLLDQSEVIPPSPLDLRKTFRTTIEIWTAYDASEVELATLGQEATGGQAYCTRQDSVEVKPGDEPSGVADFFGMEGLGRGQREDALFRVAFEIQEASRNGWPLHQWPMEEVAAAVAAARALPTSDPS